MIKCIDNWELLSSASEFNYAMILTRSMSLVSNISPVVQISSVPAKGLLLLPWILLMLFASGLDGKANPNLEFRRVELTTSYAEEGLHFDRVHKNEWRGLEEFDGGISSLS